MGNSKYRIYTLWLAISLLLLGCFDPPEFPDEPVIEFERLRFIDVEGASDSLILSFRFEDGDGDVGLGSNDLFPPYHSRNVAIDSFTVDGVDSAKLVFFGDPVTPPLYLFDDRFTVFRPFDDFAGLPPFNCLEWEILETTGDTILVQPNEFTHNIHIDIFRKVRGEYVLINDELSGNSNCPTSFDARFPIFDASNIGRALSGTINYAMLSQGFPLIFRSDTIRISFFIYDQRLNRSNDVSTPDFVLSNLTGN